MVPVIIILTILFIDETRLGVRYDKLNEEWWQTVVCIASRNTRGTRVKQQFSTSSSSSHPIGQPINLSPGQTCLLDSFANKNRNNAPMRSSIKSSSSSKESVAVAVASSATVWRPVHWMPGPVLVPVHFRTGDRRMRTGLSKYTTTLRFVVSLSKSSSSSTHLHRDSPFIRCCSFLFPVHFSCTSPGLVSYTFIPWRALVYAHHHHHHCGSPSEFTCPYYTRLEPQYMIPGQHYVPTYKQVSCRNGGGIGI